MSVGHSQGGRRDRPRWQRWLILIAAAVGLVFGTIGFYLYEAEAPHAAGEDGSSVLGHVLSSVYTAAQLFLLHTPHLDRPVNVFLEIGRWAAALAFGLTAGFALSPVFRSEWRHVRLWSRRSRVVICGAGWRGVPLARDYFRPIDPKRPAVAVVVIEKDPQNPGVDECERAGIPCVIGDATNPRILKAAGVHKAAKLIAACADDGTNLEIAVRARELTETHRRLSTPLHCYVHLGDVDFRTLVRRDQLITGTGRFRTTTVGIDVYENAARWLFQRHPLDRASTHPIVQPSPERVHLVILGFGNMGEAVLVQAARICHLANGRRLRVTVVDKAPDRQAAFRDRYSQIDQICDLEFLTFDLHSEKLGAALEAFKGEAHRLVTFVVCVPEVTRSLTIAHRLAIMLREDPESAGQQLPIYSRVSSRAGLALLLSEESERQRFAGQIVPFGMLEDSCNVETLERPEVDVLARAIHESYAEEQRSKGESVEQNAVLVDWDQLPEDMKESNRHAADHIDVKLRAMGCRAIENLGTATVIESIGDDDAKVLARMEHARYCAERFLEGWRFAPGRKSPTKRTNPTLVPWDSLPEDQRKKDEEQVRALPAILKKVGKHIVR